MPQLFIADSEDEEEDASPHSPGPVALPPLGTGQSSDPLSRGTDSTDIAFFKNVYYEKAVAIQERTWGEPNEVQPMPTKRVSGGGGMWDVPSSPGPQPASSRRKRRKVSNDGQSSPRSGEHQASGGVSGMLPPTLQIDNEAAFVITPNTMTKSQREEYQAIDYGSSVDREPVTNLQAHGQRLLDLTSSSSGTNMNSPRTVGALTQPTNTQDLPPTAPYEDLQHQLPPQTVPTETSRPRRYSSPDVIAADETTGTESQYHEPTGDDEDVRAAAYSLHQEEKQEEYQEPIIVEDDESSFEEESVKPKKKRGRPKKAKSEATTPASKPAPVKEAAPGRTAKKKRGRPRKDQATPEKGIATAIANSTGIEEKGQRDDELGLRRNAKVDDHKDEEEPTLCSEDQRGTPQPPKKSNVKKEANQHLSTTPNQPQQAAKKLEETSIKTEGSKPLQIGVKDDGKPVYRVGLSKRTRIAPLLKIIRK